MTAPPLVGGVTVTVAVVDDVTTAQGAPGAPGPATGAAAGEDPVEDPDDPTELVAVEENV